MVLIFTTTETTGMGTGNWMTDSKMDQMIGPMVATSTAEMMATGTNVEGSIKLELKHTSGVKDIL